jgi:DNA-directed RNA polymerase specialized sigma24 family protein
MQATASNFPETDLWTAITNLPEQPENYDKVLARLCRIYQSPLYLYARHMGKSRHDAEDATQGFFEYFIETNQLHKADRHKGKLRTFLLTIFTRFIWGESDKLNTLKRGKGYIFQSMDDAEESLMATADLTAKSAEGFYDDQVRRNFMKDALERLEESYRKQEKHDHFLSMRKFLIDVGESALYAGEAAKLGVELGNYKVMVPRFREKLKAAIRAVVVENMEKDASEETIESEVNAVLLLSLQ